MKFREAIAGELNIVDCEKNCKYPYKCSDCSYMKPIIDQLFAIREYGCRLAIVKEKGELPENPYDGEIDIYRNIRLATKQGYDKAQQDMLKAHYVQEEVDER